MIIVQGLTTSTLIEEISKGIQPMVSEAVRKEFKASIKCNKIIVRSKRHYSIKEVAEMCNVTGATVHQWAKIGRLTKIKVGRLTRFESKEVENLFQQIAKRKGL